MNNPKSFDLSLYVLLDREFSGGRPLVEVAAAAVRGGATILQLRDKGDDTRRFYTDAMAVVAWARAASVPVIINDRIDIALAVDADGVHVGEDDLPLFVTRRLLGAKKIIGASAGSILAADEAVAMGADYLGVGPVYEARATKPDAGPPAGLDLVREVAARSRVPICGIGGINATNAAAVIAVGASGVAVISAVGLAEDVENASHTLLQAVQNGREGTRQ